MQFHLDPSAALVPTADRVDRGCRADRPAQLPVYKDILQRSQARAVLCCAVLCCAVLCCAVLCCAALRSRTNRSSRLGRAYRIVQAVRAAVYPVIHNHLPRHKGDATGAQAVLQTRAALPCLRHTSPRGRPSTTASIHYRCACTSRENSRRCCCRRQPNRLQWLSSGLLACPSTQSLR